MTQEYHAELATLLRITLEEASPMNVPWVVCVGTDYAFSHTASLGLTCIINGTLMVTITQ